MAQGRSYSGLFLQFPLEARANADGSKAAPSAASAVRRIVLFSWPHRASKSAFRGRSVTSEFRRPIFARPLAVPREISSTALRSVSKAGSISFCAVAVRGPRSELAPSGCGSFRGERGTERERGLSGHSGSAATSKGRAEAPNGSCRASRERRTHHEALGRPSCFDSAAAPAVLVGSGVRMATQCILRV